MYLQTNHYSNDFLKIALLVMMILIISAAGGISIVWMRQQIAVSALKIRESQRDINDAQRRIRYLDSRIAEQMNPESLKSSALKLGLSMSDKSQLVRLDSRFRRSMPSRQNSIHIAHDSDPFVISFDLAVMDVGGRKP
jgi:cell division protein FtsL